MRISDLLSISQVPRAVALGELAALRQALDAEGDTRSLDTAAALRQLLTDYVASKGDEADSALRRIFGVIAEGRGQGDGIMVQGPVGAGKSHLLLTLALLLEYPQCWPEFVASHPDAELLRGALAGQRRRLVVPVPLAEHRGHNEHLEDIFFDRTERELGRHKYDIQAPLSEQTYALGLIEKHIVPRYSEELDTQARHQRPDCANWNQLRARDAQTAIAVARHLATALGYPLDFRQSRVERISRLLELLRDHDLGGVVWVVDDLSGFLASVDTKAMRGDIAFIEFLGQRAKISPFFIIAAVDEGIEDIASGAPYMLQGLRTTYDVIVPLGAAQVQQVAFHRAVHRLDGEQFADTVADVFETYQRAFGQPSFTEQELAETYPLQPIAARALQSINNRFLDKADGLLEFVSDTSGGLGRFMDRDARLLVTPAEVIEYLRPQLASHPQAAAYFNQALDYHLQNAAQLIPEDPAAAINVVRTLVALRLANIAAPADLVAECLGLSVDGAAQLPVEATRHMLENLRLTGSFVDVRRGADPESAVYLIDVQTSLSELVRQRLAAVKATLADDDDRLWRRILAACDSPTFPLAELVHSQQIEVTWLNSSRCVTAELVNFATVTPSQLSGYASELSDPTIPEVCHIFMARLLGAEHQAQYWQQLADGLAGRWRAGVIAWIPRPLTAQELDVIKQCAACHELLRQPGPDGEVQAAWRGRLLEERLTLDNEVLQIVHAAYYSGQVLTGGGASFHTDRLLQLKGDWLPTVAAIADIALDELFPGFKRLTPRRPMESRQQLDMLIDNLIRPRSCECDPEATLTELAESFMEPLGLIKIADERIWLDASGSAAAGEILDRLRQRDQTPQHERGRALSCADLARHMIKSTLGLPPELFELLVASLVRLGYLVALNDSRQTVRFEDIPSPFAANVPYVARPPLLPASQWQVLSRIVRIVLETGVSAPDAGVQQYIWERLLEARGAQLARLDGMSGRLAELQQALGQDARHWPNTTSDINDARDFYNMFDPALHSSEGLTRVIDRLEPYMREGRGVTLLSAMLRRINQLEAFLNTVAPDIISMHQYLSSPELVLAPGSDLDMRRQALLDLMGSAEELITDEMGFRRQLQIFLSGYKRQYLNFHGRAHHPNLFEQYRSVRATPEFRSLQQLQGLDIEVPHDAAHVGEMFEHCLSLRCTRQDLGMALDDTPVCPTCRLKLDEMPHIPPVEALGQAIAQGLREYVAALQSPGFAKKLQDYAQALTHDADVETRLLGVLEIPTPPSARDILIYLTNDAIAHINRVIAGKTLIPRNLDDLSQALHGRTLTKAEAQRLLQHWLDGLDQDLSDDEILHIE